MRAAGQRLPMMARLGFRGVRALILERIAYDCQNRRLNSHFVTLTCSAPVHNLETIAAHNHNSRIHYFSE